MTKGQNGAKPDIVLISSAVFLSMSIALAAILQASTMRHAATSDGRIEPKPAILASFSDDVHAKPDVFNKGLSLKVDPYTTLQRVNFKKGYWNFRFIVGYYINKIKEFEEKKHASTISSLCMDKSFVQSLKESGPFLYRYLDPSGQAADVMIPRDDCGE